MLGFYSAAHDALYGHYIYRNSLGQDVKVTVVTSDPSVYNWSDAVQVPGEMVKYISQKTRYSWNSWIEVANSA